MTGVVLVGRSSSHYTRTVRLFAMEMGVAHVFRPVLDLTSLDVVDYAGNPALKIPDVLEYLDAHVDRVLGALPPQRTLSFVEAALFCTLAHFPFRQVTDISIEPYLRLEEFCKRFGARESARNTPYRFDSA